MSTQPIFGYFTSLISEGSVVVPIAVESIVVESTLDVVESVFSFVVDPLPQALNTVTAINAIKNVYFFILQI